jgi:hypothetical protein
MTVLELSKRLGISRRTLYYYREKFPDRVPKDLDNLEQWTGFIAGVKVYDSERTEPKVGTITQADTDPEFTAQAERKERIIKLRLINEVKREELRILRRDMIPREEAEQEISTIAITVRAELMEMPGEVAEVLAGKDAADIQCHLEEAVRKVLENLSRPELFLKPEEPKE